ncbi:MAG: alpha/beta fold hydrolase [Bacteroidota bacterium]|nr:alpha/beta fold hydrolase [Bacteroidota bacterium]
MKQVRSIVILVLLCISVSLSYSNSHQQYSSIGNLALQSGDTLYDCSVGYRTFGVLNKEKSNAILFCTWYMGNSADLQGLIGNNSFVDSTKYFVIAVDALGDGVSSSPSNSIRQPGEKFPLFTIRDMVTSQYLMLKKEFGITQLHGMIGGSMGGMQIFEWIVAYPNYMKHAVAYVGTPRLSSYNRLFFTVLEKIIANGKKYSMSEIDQSELYSMAFALVLRTPEFINKEVTMEKYQEYIRSFERDTIHTERFTDLSYQLKAMINHNIFQYDSNRVSSSVYRIKTKLLLIVATKDLTVNPQAAIQFGKVVNAKIIQLTNDCGHLAPGCEFERCSKEIRLFFQ